MRRRIALGPVPVCVTAALMSLPVWAGWDHWTAPMIVASLFLMLATVSVPVRLLPIRHRH